MIHIGGSLELFRELHLPRSRVGCVGTWLCRLSALAGLLAVVVLATPIVVWLMPSRAGSFDAPPGDTLVVLGAGAEGELPDLETYWRCVYAARFFRQHSFQRLVLTGGPSDTGGEPVASVMAAYLQAARIPPEKMLIEKAARSTRENALYVARLLSAAPAGRVVVLTSDYHTRRAAACFRRAGLPVKVVAIPYFVKLGNRASLRPMLLNQLLTEYAKTLWYYWKGWT
jgi:uncharacterized SAM-binding protein YcdF (DUF218 family)